MINDKEHIIDQLKDLIPEVFEQERINWNKLKSILDIDNSDQREEFSFTWSGKKEAVQEILKESRSRLKPCKKKSFNWDSTQHYYIEGDNLEALKLLQSEYATGIDMIYIDPPYNTGKDFVYNDNFRKTQTRSKSKKSTESGNEKHADWLNMMYPRLVLAHHLLREEGFIFISIDDNEVHHLNMICDEIFGEQNFIANVVRRRRKSQANLSKNIATVHEYVLVYAKSKKAVLNKIDLSIDEAKYKNPDKDKRGPYVTMPCTNKGGAKYTISTPTGNIIEEEWRFKRSTFDALQLDNRIVFPRGGAGKPRYKLFLAEKKATGFIPNSWWSDISSNQEASRDLKQLFNGTVVFEHPKPVDLLKRIINLAMDKNGICLDFFGGSASTAQAILELNQEDRGNRKFIQIQRPEPTPKNSKANQLGYKTISEIGIERINRVIANMTKDKQRDNGLDLGYKLYKVENFEL